MNRLLHFNCKNCSIQRWWSILSSISDWWSPLWEIHILTQDWWSGSMIFNDCIYPSYAFFDLIEIFHCWVSHVAGNYNACMTPVHFELGKVHKVAPLKFLVKRIMELVLSDEASLSFSSIEMENIIWRSYITSLLRDHAAWYRTMKWIWLKSFAM